MSESRPRRLVSLRVLVTLIVVLPIAVVAAALGTISVLTSRSIGERLGATLVADATSAVAGQIMQYGSDTVRVSELYTRRITTGKLSTTELTSWEPIMFDDLATSPNVASICFGNPGGDATYLQRAHGRIELGISDGTRDCAAVEWPATLAGRVDRQHPIRTYRYDPRARPWYTAALQSSTPTWTPVYFWFGQAGSASETGTGYTRAIRRGERLLGVLTIDVTLGAVSEFLRRQSFSADGSIFIIDDQGLLVAASQGAVNSADGKRLSLADSDSPTARAIAPLCKSGGALASTRAHVDNEVVRVGQALMHPYAGADWRIITVLPESAFLSQAWQMQRRAILLACIAVAAAVVVGLIFSRRLSRPMMQLSEHAARIGSGDFAARLHLGGARELSQLAEETNRMAAGLRQRLELEKSLELATHVQQSLLPRQTPTFRGLDIAARCQYCDSTGGDYYDFIDVAGLSEDRAFIAVGDVMGHGIGSALLMATARAALRSSAAAGQLPLGQLLGRVNDVLASDPHGMFMTLALIVIERKTQRIRWVSAGHDPVIAYDPAAGEFVEMEGGDIPLGILASHPFEEFSCDRLRPGWVLFAGTDGVWEARNPADEMFDKDRVRDVIRAHHDRPANQIAEAIHKTLIDFIAGATIRDDITFVVIKIVATP